MSRRPPRSTRSDTLFPCATLVRSDLIKEMRGNMGKSGFTAFKTLPFPQPCYPTGWWSCTLAKKSGDFHFRKVDARAKKFETLYYSADTHHAALTLPPFVAAALEN